MTISEFFKEFRDSQIYDIVIYDCDDDTEYFTTTDDIEQDFKKEFLDNAEIVNWYIRDNTFNLDVVEGR